MAMSRRHFQKIADAIAAEMCVPIIDPEFERHRDEVCLSIAERLADACASENPNFDRARFLAACQPSKE